MHQGPGETAGCASERRGTNTNGTSSDVNQGLGETAGFASERRDTSTNGDSSDVNQGLGKTAGFASGAATPVRMTIRQM